MPVKPLAPTPNQSRLKLLVTNDKSDNLGSYE